MADINLHSIFRKLIDDENFLRTIIEVSKKTPNEKNKNDNGFSIMKNIITEYVILIPYEKQPYEAFPLKMRSILSPKYYRLGIKNITENKNLDIVNVSFLNSLNILFRPDIHQFSAEDQILNINLLEEFICNKIRRNYKIDKVKKTRKAREMNDILIEDLKNGKISHEIIQYIVNIFEINLIVFDLSRSKMNFYWARGTKYPFLNLFKKIMCMSYVQGNYEPIMPLNGVVSSKQTVKMYAYILTHPDDFEYIFRPELSPFSFSYIVTWNMPFENIIKVIEYFYNKKQKTVTEHLTLIKKYVK